MKPNFLVIGAARSGTTSLFKYLESHPDIFMSEIKEINFFSNDKYWRKGFAWYEKHFSKAHETAIGEASTSYTRFPANPDVPKRIHAYNPDIKLIYLLRDPIERFKSHYLQRIAAGHETRMFDDILAHHPKDPTLWQGCYAYQLDQYLQYFSREQIHLFTMDELKFKPEATVRGIYRFLGVDEDFQDVDLTTQHNANKVVTRKGPIGRSILKFYHQNIEQKTYPYKIKRLFTGLAELDSKPAEKPQPTSKQLDYLADFYRSDVDRIKHEFGVDTSHWLNR
ncbi:sulfotransferase family protein [Saccharospirillum salsuginis]|uniref:Sulfotransferase domain-containing protein n=1 Tax=Saccharospirillum salsuginis TaxID=418750 RepID=A0A918K7E5_9GAMM|nr:sulfotransferase [Saccharospirillum salsuginis]GGX49607.1 hypothetical protein GCM10007392_16180 [Saccharospirillum salsuginis]